MRETSAYNYTWQKQQHQQQLRIQQQQQQQQANKQTNSDKKCISKDCNSTAAILGFQFGLFQVVAPLSFLRSISLASLFAISKETERESYCRA